MHTKISDKQPLGCSKECSLRASPIAAVSNELGVRTPIADPHTAVWCKRKLARIRIANVGGLRIPLILRRQKRSVVYARMPAWAQNCVQSHREVATKPAGWIDQCFCKEICEFASKYVSFASRLEHTATEPQLVRLSLEAYAQVSRSNILTTFVNSQDFGYSEGHQQPLCRIPLASPCAKSRFRTLCIPLTIREFKITSVILWEQC